MLDYLNKVVVVDLCLNKELKVTAKEALKLLVVLAVCCEVVVTEQEIDFVKIDCFDAPATN